MFDHRNFAVDGLMPGLFSHLAIGTLGAFETTVVIEPVVFAGGGGYAPWTPAKSTKPDRYRVTIQVVINGKTYSETKIVDDLEARVLAKFSGIQQFAEDSIMVSLNGIQQMVESSDPIIKVTLL